MQVIYSQTKPKYAFVATTNAEQLVSISPDGVVSINWPEVERKAAEWQQTNGIDAAWSMALLAARNQANKE